jgi:uncharacterized protein (TIGR00255 family)
VIRSMTGFAAVSRDEAGRKVSATIKAVNHRFLDVVVKAPSALGSAEGPIRALAQQRLARGRVEIALGLEMTVPPAKQVVLDEALIERVAAAIESARERGIVSGGLTASDVLRIPQVLDIRSAPETDAGVSEQVAALVERVVSEAFDALVTMRETEGRFLGADLTTRVETMAGLVSAIEGEARGAQRGLEARLRERLAALPPDLQADSAALAQEVVRFVARSDIDEELVRLRSHFSHWRLLAEGPEPCGRKLDFLIQEMNREINTTGSKVEGAKATELVIEAKAELERIREQVQNVE